MRAMSPNVTPMARNANSIGSRAATTAPKTTIKTSRATGSA